MSRKTGTTGAVVSGKKQCSKCAEFKDQASFNKDSSAPGGLRYCCKACLKAARTAPKTSPTEKQCVVCAEVRPAEEFAKGSTHRDGLRNECKLCSAKRRRAVIQVVPAEKRCQLCKTIKSAGEFYKNTTSKDGLSTYCKPCVRVRRFQQIYGLSREDYAALLRESDNRCCVCRVDFDIQSASNRACVDHDHVTGAVRSLLCSRCNTGLGSFDDSPEKLRAAAEYLERRSVKGAVA